MTPKSKEELRKGVERLVAALASSGDNFRIAGEVEPVANEVKEQYVESFMQLFTSHHQQQLEQAVREARCDEVELAMKKQRSIIVKSGVRGQAEHEFTTSLFDAVPLAKLRDRLAELQSTKEDKS